MSKGRKRIPAKILELRGSQYTNKNYTCAYRTNELDPEPRVPVCPQGLTKEGKTAWHKIIKQLQKYKILSLLDSNALERYAETYAMWKQAKEDTKKGLYFTDQKGIVRINPAVKIYNECCNILSRLETEFGLTPVARTRIKSEKPDNEKDKDDERFFG